MSAVENPTKSEDTHSSSKHLPKIEDLLEPINVKVKSCQYSNANIPKNQKEFGHKKRIKP